MPITKVLANMLLFFQQPTSKLRGGHFLAFFRHLTGYFQAHSIFGIWCATARKMRIEKLTWGHLEPFDRPIKFWPTFFRKTGRPCKFAWSRRRRVKIGLNIKTYIFDVEFLNFFDFKLFELNFWSSIFWNFFNFFEISWIFFKG